MENWLIQLSPMARMWWLCKHAVPGAHPCSFSLDSYTAVQLILLLGWEESSPDYLYKILKCNLVKYIPVALGLASFYQWSLCRGNTLPQRPAGMWRVFSTHGFSIKESNDPRKLCPRLVRTPTRLDSVLLGACLGSRRPGNGKSQAQSWDKNISAYFVLSCKRFCFCNRDGTQTSGPSFCTFDIILNFSVLKN